MTKIDERLLKDITEERQELKKIFDEEPTDSPYQNSELLRKLLADFDTVTQHPLSNLSGEKRYEILRIALTLICFGEKEEANATNYPHLYENYDFLLDQCQRNATKLEFHKQELEQINPEWEAFKKQRASSILPDNLSPEKDATLVTLSTLCYVEQIIAGMELKELIYAGNLSIQTARNLIQFAVLKLENKEETTVQEKQLRADILTGMEFDRNRNKFESEIIREGNRTYTTILSRTRIRILDILDATLRQQSKRNYKELEKILSVDKQLDIFLNFSLPVQDKFNNLLLQEKDDTTFLSKLEEMLTEEKNNFLNYQNFTSKQRNSSVPKSLLSKRRSKQSASSNTVSTPDETLNDEVTSLTIASSKSLSKS